MADRRIENSRLLRHRLVRGSVHYASTPTLVSVGLNDPDSTPYNSSSGNDDSSDNNNDGNVSGMIRFLTTRLKFSDWCWFLYEINENVVK